MSTKSGFNSSYNYVYLTYAYEKGDLAVVDKAAEENGQIDETERETIKALWNKLDFSIWTRVGSWFKKGKNYYCYIASEIRNVVQATKVKELYKQQQNHLKREESLALSILSETETSVSTSSRTESSELSEDEELIEGTKLEARSLLLPVIEPEEIAEEIELRIDTLQEKIERSKKFLRIEDENLRKEIEAVIGEVDAHEPQFLNKGIDIKPKLDRLLTLWQKLPYTLSFKQLLAQEKEEAPKSIGEVRIKWTDGKKDKEIVLDQDFLKELKWHELDIIEQGKIRRFVRQFVNKALEEQTGIDDVYSAIREQFLPKASSSESEALPHLKPMQSGEGPVVSSENAQKVPPNSTPNSSKLEEQLDASKPSQSQEKSQLKPGRFSKVKNKRRKVDLINPCSAAAALIEKRRAAALIESE